MDRVCKKCNSRFLVKLGLLNFCSLQCRNSRSWSILDKQKKSESARNSVTYREGGRKVWRT